MRLALILLTFPVLFALDDPGEGLSTQAARRTARVTQWQAQYEALSDAAIDHQALLAVQDLFAPACLFEAVKRRMGDQDATPAEAEAWITERLHLLTNQDNIDFLSERCDPPTNWTPAAGEQGEPRNRVLVIGGEVVAQGIRHQFPVLPRIGSVPPLVWAATASGECTIGAYTGPCYASQHDWSEAHLHLLEAIVRAEGVLARFQLLEAETTTGEGLEAVTTTWRQEIGWTDAAE